MNKVQLCLILNNFRNIHQGLSIFLSFRIWHPIPLTNALLKKKKYQYSLCFILSVFFHALFAAIMTAHLPTPCHIFCHCLLILCTEAQLQKLINKTSKQTNKTSTDHQCIYLPSELLFISEPLFNPSRVKSSGQWLLLPARLTEKHRASFFQPKAFENSYATLISFVPRASLPLPSQIKSNIPFLMQKNWQHQWSQLITPVRKLVFSKGKLNTVSGAFTTPPLHTPKLKSPVANPSSKLCCRFTSRLNAFIL